MCMEVYTVFMIIFSTWIHHYARACYADGCLVPPKPGTTADPKPSAGNDGTTIIVSTFIFMIYICPGFTGVNSDKRYVPQHPRSLICPAQLI